MDSPALTELLGGGTKGNERGGLERLQKEVSNAKWEAGALLMVARSQEGLEVACRTDQSRERQGDDQRVPDSHSEGELMPKLLVTVAGREVQVSELCQRNISTD